MTLECRLKINKVNPEFSTINVQYFYGRFCRLVYHIKVIRDFQRSTSNIVFVAQFYDCDERKKYFIDTFLHLCLKNEENNFDQYQVISSDIY